MRSGADRCIHGGGSTFRTEALELSAGSQVSYQAALASMLSKMTTMQNNINTAMNNLNFALECSREGKFYDSATGLCISMEGVSGLPGTADFKDIPTCAAGEVLVPNAAGTQLQCATMPPPTCNCPALGIVGSGLPYTSSNTCGATTSSVTGVCSGTSQQYTYNYTCTVGGWAQQYTGVACGGM